MYYTDQFHPLAITKIDEEQICVAGINENGEWIRPEPLLHSDSRHFSYRSKVQLTLGPSTATEMRIEDRDFIRDNNITTDSLIDGEDWEGLFQRYLDSSVKDIFESGRSVGLIKVNMLSWSYGRVLGSRNNFRIQFEDRTKERFNFILAETRLKEWLTTQVSLQSSDLKQHLAQQLLKLPKDVYLTVGLTRRTDNFPGPYNGCHPLVVGFHTIPDYLSTDYSI